MKYSPKPKHRLAADLLARGKTQRAVARILGITPRTLNNWRNDPDFNRIEEAARKDYLEAIDTDLEAYRFNEAALREGRRYQGLSEGAQAVPASMRPPFAKGGDASMDSAKAMISYGLQ